jgi:hypothetical protein
MGLFSSIKKGIKKVGKAVSKAVNKATDAVADVVETIGNGIGDGLTWLGDQIPGIGGVFGWLGDILSGVTDLVSGVIKGIGAVVGGVLSGIIRIVGGIFTLDWDGIVGGFGDIVGGIGGAVIGILGKAAALVQVVFTIGRPRRLNDVELRIIGLVFEDSIATYNVRVVDGFAGIYSLNDRPFVLGNTIYMKDKSASRQPEVFAHECVHVWQNQHFGSAYAAEALASQWWGAGYDWESEADKGKEWEDFEREAQGESIEAIYSSGGTVGGATGNGAFFAESDETKRVFMFGGKDRTALGNEAVRVIRGETPWRLSELFS